MSIQGLKDSVALPPHAETTAKVNHEFVRLLESALADAKAGRIVAGGVVAVVGPSSAYAFSSMDRYPFEIIGAAKILQDDVAIKMRQAAQSQSRIVRAGAMPRQ